MSAEEIRHLRTPLAILRLRNALIDYESWDCSWSKADELAAAARVLLEGMGAVEVSTPSGASGARGGSSADTKAPARANDSEPLGSPAPGVNGSHLPGEDHG